MITIESKEDIELLLEFFQVFNIQYNVETEDTSEKSESDDLNERISEIEKKMEVVLETVKFHGNTLMKMKKKELTPNTEETVTKPKRKRRIREDAPNSEKCIRDYSITQYEGLPQIKSMTKDGKLVGGRGTFLVYTIQDLLKLKPLISSSMTFEELSQKIGVSHPVVRIMCYGIETGFYDGYFREWEQLQADNYYGNWKPVIVENNPQKRRENGLV